MNTHPPTPTPACAAYAPLLPLLTHDLLDEATAKDVRAHLAACAYCQTQAALDEEMATAFRRRFLAVGGEQNSPFSPEEIARMLDRQEHTPSVTLDATPGATPRLSRRARYTMAVAAAAFLLVSLVTAGLFTRLGGHAPGGPAANQGTQTALPTVGSSIQDLTQLGSRIDVDLNEIAADQQAATTDNTQQDQVQQ